MSAQIHLWAFLQGIGHYPSGWRHEDADPAGVFTMDYYRKVGALAERGMIDAIVYGDQLQSRGAGGRTPERLARVRALLDIVGGYAMTPAFKGIMSIVDGDEGWLPVRPPLVPLDSTQLARLRQQMAAFGLDPEHD